jgi:rhodanese-related sulfurtransferase
VIGAGSTGFSPHVSLVGHGTTGGTCVNISRRDGKHVLYRPSDPAVLDLVAALRRVGERKLAEVREIVGGYFQERDALEPVSGKELARRLKDGLVTVLDVRPEDEFAASHLPMAINIPLRELSRRLREIPKNHDIVAYCRGPYCVLAFEAVAVLRTRGFKVRRLEDGFPEWKAARLPIARGEEARQGSRAERITGGK